MHDLGDGVGRDGRGWVGIGRVAGVTYGINLCLCTSLAHQTEGSTTSMLLQD